MARINCENRNRKEKIDLSKVKRIASTVLSRLNRKKAEVNIVFVSNQKIRSMNRRYRGIDEATDVLAFEGGDIIISSDQAKQNTKVYNTSFAEETALYVIHGILHLTGHEDRTKKGKARMRRLENELIRKIRKFL